MKITYTESLNTFTADRMHGFFVGWPNPPSPQKLFKILANSSHIILAVDADTDHVVGFINAISDKSLCAYIPLLEVLPNYQKTGIGSELVKRMLHQLKDYYMVDLSCDENMVGFYERFDMTSSTSMIIRHYSNQSGF